jgi:hypothetical protein
MKEATYREPQTPAEWQEAVDIAEACLLLDASRQYGLVVGGSPVNVARCEEVLRRGRELGVTPAADCVDKFVLAHTAR